MCVREAREREGGGEEGSDGWREGGSEDQGRDRGHVENTIDKRRRR